MARAAVPPPSVPAALNAQILATEHWSLLASRTTTQNEVLTRISMFLTFVSATLVSLALVGQAIGFGSPFPVVAIALLALALLVGLLTQVRVFNVANEDLMYVLAMNRLRAAYAELSPGVERWFMSSRHDDLAGAGVTYNFFAPQRDASRVLGSSMVFIDVVNAALAGLLTASVALSMGAPFTLALGLGLAVGLVFAVIGVIIGYRAFSAVWRNHTPLAPTPGA